MIVATNIDVVEMPDDKGEIHRMIQQQSMGQMPPIYDSADNPVDREVMIETIQGRRFRNSKGLDIVLGMSNQAQEALGIWFDTVENQANIIDDLHNSNNRLMAELNMLRKTYDAFEKMGFWSRLRFAFTRKYKL